MKKSFAIIMILIAFTISGCSNTDSTKNDTQESTATTSAQEQEKEQSAAEAEAAEAANQVADIPYTVHGVPVLMYHSIAVEEGNPIRMPVEQFDSEMKYIKDQGYTTLTMKELYSYFENQVPIPEKSIVITLDDGYSDNYTAAFPVLKKYGLKATVFVVTSTIDVNPNCLTSAQIKEMDKAGIQIESHTVTHRDLDSLSYSEQLAELKDSKAALEKLLGRTVDYVAYPTGKYNDDTIKAVAEAGYKMAFTTNGRWSDTADGILTLDRVYISTFHSMDVFKNRLTNPDYPVN
ncbi:MAG TPA: polysaccharide deacetylase family protein [Clostridiaceae bacterium]|nr:polysaccharide deacetylase family protein [Clostridiaceae bacterium]